MWYPGDIGSAIGTTKKERRILFVFNCKGELFTVMITCFNNKF